MYLWQKHQKHCQNYESTPVLSVLLETMFCHNVGNFSQLQKIHLLSLRFLFCYRTYWVTALAYYLNENI